MLKKLFEKIKNIVLTFRISILLLFSTLFVLGILCLIITSYYRFSASTSNAAFKLMQDLSDIANKKIDMQFKNIMNESQYSSYLIQSQLINPEQLQNMVVQTHDLMRAKTQSQAISDVEAAIWGDTKGNFVRARLEVDGSIASEILFNSKSIPTRTSVTRIPQSDVIKQTKRLAIAKNAFDFRSHPWYVLAKKSQHTIITDMEPYDYFGEKHIGIMVATPTYNQEGQFIGVFGLHIRMDYFRVFIESIKVTPNSVIFIVTADGRLVALPHPIKTIKPIPIDSLKFPWMIKSFQLYQKTGLSTFSFYENQKKYLVNYKVLSAPKNAPWYMGIIIPEKDLMGDLAKTNLIMGAIGLLILLIGLVLISKTTKWIVNPLNKLTIEAKLIQDLHLDEPIQIQSWIKEIRLLTNALNSMKNGLRAFRKYVPAKLVRQIIQAGDEALIGGAKRKIAILFSDIQDFTLITEQAIPEKLMSQLYLYFEELSTIITEEKGTVDKYIGDSIMAFWGAPLFDKDPSYHSAITALNCIARLSQLNQDWIKNGFPPLITRMGIHIGDAIVGNIGSHERFNYTAIGDTINIASRLERINKIYGTTILVSGEFYQHIHDRFVLRMVDSIRIRGKLATSEIYELLAKGSHDLDFDIDGYNKIFAQGFAEYRQQNWDKAMLCFNECLRLYSCDTVAALFIQRCQSFKITPPPADWDGTWQY